jgi:hypothetical protein
LVLSTSFSCKKLMILFAVAANMRTSIASLPRGCFFGKDHCRNFFLDIWLVICHFPHFAFYMYLLWVFRGFILSPPM